MRTTLTLEADVAAMLRKALRRRGATLKGVINEALRRGLPALGEEPRRTTYRIRPVHLGPARIPVDNIGDAMAIVEGERYR